MALFGSKKKKESAVSQGDTLGNLKGVTLMRRDLTQVLQQARITEKASMHQGNSVYTFNVSSTATKRDIMQAVRSLYKVTPLRVAIVRIPTKSIRSRKTGQMGHKGGGKKAYVYLKRGETITLG